MTWKCFSHTWYKLNSNFEEQPKSLKDNFVVCHYLQFYKTNCVKYKIN